ncbi:MAG TPA: hypothetical protein PLP63_06590 [Saprospiraceae bacterium]|nr:hypothetical protein [Saprospiraceae bacterium]
MKKSKEYAVDILAFYNSNMHKEDLKKLVMDYVVKEVFAKLTDEMQEIAKARNCNNDICLEAIMLEQIDKWKAIVRKVNKEVPMLREDGFLKALQSVGLYEHTHNIKLEQFIDNKLSENEERTQA